MNRYRFSMERVVGEEVKRSPEQFSRACLPYGFAKDQEVEDRRRASRLASIKKRKEKNP